MRKQEIVKAVLFMAIGGAAAKAVQVFKNKKRQNEMVIEDEL